MRFLVFACLWIALALGCGTNDKKSAPQAQACTTDDDCQAGWPCLDAQCVDPNARAMDTVPRNAVTPDKVKRQVETIGQDRENRADKLLDGL